MGVCQDCNKNDAEVIIYDKDKGRSFLVCYDCVNKDKDIVMDHTIKDIVDFETG